MKKSQLVRLIKEELQGYSKYLGKTKGGTSDEFMQILTKIAKGEDEKYERRPDTDPLPYEELHGYASETTPEGEHEVWAIYFDPKTDTYNYRHRVSPDTVFGKNAKIQRGDIDEGEGSTNIFSKHPYIKDLLNAMINTDGTVELQIYGTKGGLPTKQTAAIPIEDFTPEYVEKQVSDKYTIDTEFRKGIQQFVDSVQNTNA